VEDDKVKFEVSEGPKGLQAVQVTDVQGYQLRMHASKAA
jgi:hypothetical protein